MNHEAVFVLSTGRCGTQWLAELFSAAGGDRVEVAHEPLDSDYSPREMLGARDPQNLDPALAAPILEHVDATEQTLASRPYIECGHPSWSTLPYLLRRFDGRARVVHLVRHPVPTALSWLTHTAYMPPLAPHLREKVLLSPYDEGVQFPSYRERWPSLTPYEKALFYWAEVNAFGLHLERETAAPWLRVRFEDLVTGAAVRPLLEFVGIEASASQSVPAPVDEFRYLSPAWFDPRAIEAHPDVLRIARTLGYDPRAFDEEKLRRRYCGA